MTAYEKSLLLSREQQQALNRACASVAPSWPLDRLIAVNPLWGMKEASFDEVSARLSALAYIKCLMPPSYYLQLWQTGEIESSHLAQAAERLGYAGPYKNLLKVVSELGSLPHWHNISDLVDAGRDRQHKMAWRDEITQQISQFCAAHFQPDGPLNAERLGCQDSLYQHWLNLTLMDRGIAILMDEPGLGGYFKHLPRSESELFQAVIDELGVDAPLLEHYAQALLLDINGWASWVAYRVWQESLEGADTDQESMRSLLAIRMAWELVLWRYIHDKNADQGQRLTQWWQEELQGLPQLLKRHRQAQQPLWVWHTASELAYQSRLHQALREAQPPEPLQARPKLQAAFCIDVRSEPMRRALEAQDPGIQTLGFAGFFGLPLSYSPAGTDYRQPHLPGLLAPSLSLDTVADSGNTAESKSAARLNGPARIQEWFQAAAASFSAVETSGLFYAGKLFRQSLAPKACSQPGGDHLPGAWRLHKEGRDLSLFEKVELVQGVLNAMGLVSDFAPVVLLVGHGSKSSNNPHAAGLECGACGGQTGEVSVRVLAGLLNDPEVRLGLSHKGLQIPEDTRFVPALHNTLQDRISVLEPTEHLSETGHRWLAAASARAQKERAPALGLEPDRSDLDKSLARRNADWSQVRPEWGLANNAAFIAAPCRLTAPVNLKGRSFLHDYDWHQDQDFAVLETIMTAPMVVAHWINMQYNLSTLDNHKFGSGNKVLHNVVGGHIGVFEGNGGDLRIGLPIQSLHDGERWMHQPLRLSVYLAAPGDAIREIVSRHEMLAQLVDNDWLYLFRLSDTGERIEQLYRGGWLEV